MFSKDIKMNFILFEQNNICAVVCEFESTTVPKEEVPFFPQIDTSENWKNVLYKGKTQETVMNLTTVFEEWEKEMVVII